MANIQPQLKDLGIWEWLIKAGESLEPARIPGFWLAKNLTELWLAEISMTQQIFHDSDFLLEDPGARLPKPYNSIQIP